jgi:hypothetical protein
VPGTTLVPLDDLYISPTGLLPSTADLSRSIRLYTPHVMSGPQPRINPVWALPRSLAATQGIDVSFSSSGYLDVSVRRVASSVPMYSVQGTYTLL